MRVHVCQVINTLGVGGAEQYVAQLSNYLFGKGFDISIIAGEPQPLRERLNPGIKVKTLKLHPGSARSLIVYLINLLPVICNLVIFFRANGVTVVHTHLVASALPAWIAARLCGIPVIHSKMHTEAIPSRYERVIFSSRLPLFMVDYFIAFSRYFEFEIIRHWHAPPERIFSSSIGVDPVHFNATEELRHGSRIQYGLSDDARVMLVVSRLHPDKDVALAIRAVRAMDDPEAVLLIVGDGPERLFLERLANELPGRTRIVFLGQLQDPRSAYGAADLILQTTRGPNLGTVVLEAMAMGVPIVIAYRDDEEYKMATDTLDGEGLGVVVEASPAALAIGISKLLACPDFESLRRAVRDFVEQRHSRQIVYSEMATFYQSLSRRFIRGLQ